MKKGFTLIELLVVISIIAILSTIGLTTFQGVQKSARDGSRKSDLRTLATALEIYNQKNNQYPVPAQGINCSFCINDYSSDGSLCGGTHFSDQISPYINALPHDPSYSVVACGSYNQNYLYTSDCSVGPSSQQCYRLWAVMENPSNANAPNTSIGGRPAYDYFYIQNP